MKLYTFINDRKQQTTLNTDLIICYFINDLTLTVKLTGHIFEVVFTNQKEMQKSYTHLHDFMQNTYPDSKE